MGRVIWDIELVWQNGVWRMVTIGIVIEDDEVQIPPKGSLLLEEGVLRTTGTGRKRRGSSRRMARELDWGVVDVDLDKEKKGEEGEELEDSTGGFASVPLTN